ncbi:hypothetical protein DFS34DRAFT_640079 [Phlyctochytrium arcticum]|nr:hypothetical protein DFS34DRAFT_640079 [Phlyctochytrium arcticum]
MSEISSCSKRKRPASNLVQLEIPVACPYPGPPVPYAKLWQDHLRNGYQPVRTFGKRKRLGFDVYGVLSRSRKDEMSRVRPVLFPRGEVVTALDQLPVERNLEAVTVIIFCHQYANLLGWKPCGVKRFELALQEVTSDIIIGVFIRLLDKLKASAEPVNSDNWEQVLKSVFDGNHPRPYEGEFASWSTATKISVLAQLCIRFQQTIPEVGRTRPKYRPLTTFQSSAYSSKYVFWHFPVDQYSSRLYCEILVSEASVENIPDWEPIQKARPIRVLYLVAEAREGWSRCICETNGLQEAGIRELRTKLLETVRSQPNIPVENPNRRPPKPIRLAPAVKKPIVGTGETAKQPSTLSNTRTAKISEETNGKLGRNETDTLKEATKSGDSRQSVAPSPRKRPQTTLTVDLTDDRIAIPKSSKDASSIKLEKIDSGNKAPSLSKASLGVPDAEMDVDPVPVTRKRNRIIEEESDSDSSVSPRRRPRNATHVFELDSDSELELDKYVFVKPLEECLTPSKRRTSQNPSTRSPTDGEWETCRTPTRRKEKMANNLQLSGTPSGSSKAIKTEMVGKSEKSHGVFLFSDTLTKNSTERSSKLKAGKEARRPSLPNSSEQNAVVNEGDNDEAVVESTKTLKKTIQSIVNTEAFIKSCSDPNVPLWLKLTNKITEFETDTPIPPHMRTKRWVESLGGLVFHPLLEDGNRRMDDLLVHACNRWIEILKRVPEHEPFLYMISDQYVPGYSKVIKRPMSLCTLQRNLLLRNYPTFHPFISDFLLIFNNCRKFNSPRSPIVVNHCAPVEMKFLEAGCRLEMVVGCVMDAEGLYGPGPQMCLDGSGGRRRTSGMPSRTPTGSPSRTPVGSPVPLSGRKKRSSGTNGKSTPLAPPTCTTMASSSSSSTNHKRPDATKSKSMTNTTMTTSSSTNHQRLDAVEAKSKTSPKTSTVSSTSIATSSSISTSTRITTATTTTSKKAPNTPPSAPPPNSIPKPNSASRPTQSTCPVVPPFFNSQRRQSLGSSRPAVTAPAAELSHRPDCCIM